MNLRSVHEAKYNPCLWTLLNMRTNYAICLIGSNGKHCWKVARLHVFIAFIDLPIFLLVFLKVFFPISEYPAEFDKIYWLIWWICVVHSIHSQISTEENILIFGYLIINQYVLGLNNERAGRFCYTCRDELINPALIF